MNDLPLRAERGRYLCQAAKDAPRSEAGGEQIKMPHSVQDREYGGLGTHRGRDVVRRGIERVSLHREEDKVVGVAEVARLHRAGPEVSVAVQAVDAQAVARDLLGALTPDKERHVA